MVVKKRQGTWAISYLTCGCSVFWAAARTSSTWNLVEAAFSACVNRAFAEYHPGHDAALLCRLVPWGCFLAEKNLLIFGFCLSNLTRIFVKLCQLQTQIKVLRFLWTRFSTTETALRVAPRLLSRWKNALVIVYKRLTPLPNRKQSQSQDVLNLAWSSIDLGSFNSKCFVSRFKRVFSAPWTRSCCSWERLGNRRAIKSDKLLIKPVCTLQLRTNQTSWGSCILLLLKHLLLKQ